MRDEISRLRDMAFWEDVEAGRVRQVAFPGFAQAPTVAERAFVLLAREWRSLVPQPASGQPLPGEARGLAYSALLLANESEGEFSGFGQAWGKANRKLASENLVDPEADELPWELCLLSREDSSAWESWARTGLARLLRSEGYSARLFGMELAWLCRRHLSPESVLPALLENIATSCEGFSKGAGLAAAFFSDQTSFWRVAALLPPGEFPADQYRRQVARLRKTGALSLQAHFWRLETECRRRILDKVQMLRLWKLDPDWGVRAIGKDLVIIRHQARKA